MSPEKYAAGLALNAMENRAKILEEGIASTEKVLAGARASLAETKQQLAEQRAALANLPD